MTNSELINQKIILPGGAGLVGQNLVTRLIEKGYQHIVVLDKHRANLAILQKTQPTITTEYADLAEPGTWQRYLRDADVVVMLQAQIGGNDPHQFIRNNCNSTQLILDGLKNSLTQPYLVHVSSSVVVSVADDLYTNSKKQQEALVVNSGIDCPILRPTLMFGWFDRKHLGWLARFLNKVPVFPIPDDGRFMRQPLFAGDFCQIIISCIENKIQGGVFNISGHEKIDYIDMIREIKRATGSHAAILKIPYRLFHLLLRIWGLFDQHPPFTTQQLEALIAKDEFEIIDWPGRFNVPCTPFAQAIDETFNAPIYSKVILEF